jgi:hypothetical protein
MSSFRPFRSKRPQLSIALGSLTLLLILLLVITSILILIPSNRIITEEDFEGVIFSNRNAADSLRYMLVNERTEEAYWTPSNAQIVDLEVRLDSYVNEQVPILASWLNTYRRQYFGFIRDGKQLIMVVGFCKPVSIDWRREPVTLPESGGCYFEGQYDATNDDFLYLWEGVRR